MNEVLTAKDLMGFLGLSRTTVYSMIRRGTVPYVAIGGTRRFLKSSILEWLEKNQRGAI